MSKTSLALTSLVAAVPGAVLVYVLVMAFLNHSDDMSGALMGVAGLTLLAGAAMAAMPAAVFVLGPKPPRPETDEDAEEEIVETAAPAAVAEDEAEEFGSGEIDVAEEADDEFASDEFVAAEGEEDIFEVEDEEDLEEPPPKKQR